MHGFLSYTYEHMCLWAYSLVSICACEHMHYNAAMILCSYLQCPMEIMKMLPSPFKPLCLLKDISVYISHKVVLWECGILLNYLKWAEVFFVMFGSVNVLPFKRKSLPTQCHVFHYCVFENDCLRRHFDGLSICN